MNINPVHPSTTASFQAGIQKVDESLRANPAGETQQAAAALSIRQDLLQKLASLPEIRPEALERGRKFLESKNNEHATAIDALALKFASASVWQNSAESELKPST